MVRAINKNKVFQLRKRGRSINEIVAELSIAKSTVSSWCRNIRLGPKQIKRLVKRQALGSYKGRKKFLERIKKEKTKEVALLQKQGIKEIGKITKRDLLIAGVSMYWSEGYTYSGGEQVGFTNSDPKMVLLILRWFKEVCEISGSKFSFQVKINMAHMDRAREVENYWSQLTKFPLSQFNKTVFIKSKTKKVYPSPESYFGTLRITVRQGTKLRRKINGWIEGLAAAGRKC